MHVCAHIHMDGRMDGRTDGRMDGWMDWRDWIGWMDGLEGLDWMDGWMNGWTCIEHTHIYIHMLGAVMLKILRLACCA